MLEEGRALLIVVAASIVLTAAMAWTTIGDPDRQLFGRELVGREHDPFTVMELYAAGAMPPPYAQPATDGPAIALTAAIGPVRAYNLLTLASFPLAALFAFVHARWIVGSSIGAGVAALLFAFAPVHVAHAAYHVHIAQVQWLPLAFWLTWRLLERPGPARGAAAAGGLLLVIASSAYLGLIAIVVVPVGIASAVAAGRLERRARAFTLAAAAWAAALALLLLALGWFAPTVLNRPASLAFPAFALDLHTAQAWRYVAPIEGHPWSSDREVVAADGAVEQQLSLGLAVMVLAAIALFAPTSRDSRFHRFRPALVAVAFAALLCSLAPSLQLGPFTVAMPSRVLHAVAPMFRAFARFGIVVNLMVTVLAGAGLAWLLVRPSWPGRAMGVALVAIAAVEYLPPQPASRDVLPTTAHRAMATTADARILDCTAPSAGATAGFGLLMRPPVVVATGVLADCAEPEFPSKLAAFGFTHVILRRDADRAGWLDTALAPPGTTRRAGDANAGLYEVAVPRPPVYLVELLQFSPREFRGADSWRWMGGSGAIVLANLTSAEASVAVDLELEPFAGERVLDVRSPSGILPPLRVDRRQWYRVGPLTITPGTTTVTVAADRAVTPASIGLGTDPRPLSVRVRGWRVSAR